MTRSARVILNRERTGAATIETNKPEELTLAIDTVLMFVRLHPSWSIHLLQDGDNYLTVKVYGRTGLGRGALKAARSILLCELTEAVRAAWRAANG